jgi:hypothetical protein
MAPQAINMVFTFDVLEPGASVTFTWAYILNLDDIVSTLDILYTVAVIQPTTTASGESRSGSGATSASNLF